MAAGGTPGNVLLGPGRIYYAPLGTAEPTTCSTALPSAWITVGYTDTGTAFTTDTTQAEVEVAEELDPIAYVATKRVSSVAFAMAETTKKRLMLALGSGASGVDDAIAFEPPDPSARLAVMLVWDSLDVVDATNRRWLMRSCIPSGAVTMERRKAPQKTLFTVTFNLQKPASGAAPYKIFPNATGQV